MTTPKTPVPSPRAGAATSFAPLVLKSVGEDGGFTTALEEPARLSPSEAGAFLTGIAPLPSRSRGTVRVSPDDDGAEHAITFDGEQLRTVHRRVR